jgi:uroporphyrinogen III methyltransferase / synthase
VSGTLEQIPGAVRDAGLATPLLTVIGPSAALRDQLAWFEGRPLFGKRVLVTRTRQQASALSQLLRQEGAVPVELPALELIPVATDEEMEAVAQRLESRGYNWCLFTSTNAVDFVLEYLERTGRDSRAFAGCRVAALGSATAASLRSKGLRAELVAPEFTSAGLLDALPLDVGGMHFLLPRARGGSDLRGELRARGATVHEVLLYDSAVPSTVDKETLQLLHDGGIDVATFASSSSLRNLASMLGDDLTRLKETVVACIGPVTATTAREFGLEVKVEPSTHTIPALVEALKIHFSPAP